MEMLPQNTRKEAKAEKQASFLFKLPPPCATCLRTQPLAMAVLSRREGVSLAEAPQLNRNTKSFNGAGRGRRE